MSNFALATARGRACLGSREGCYQPAGEMSSGSSAMHIWFGTEAAPTEEEIALSSLRKGPYQKLLERSQLGSNSMKARQKRA